MLVRPTCALCARPGRVVCPWCAEDLRPAPSLANPLGLDACWALLDYASSRALITALKNGGRRDLVSWLADAMAAQVHTTPSTFITWAPTAPPRRRARGYDQAELLARAIARRLGLESGPLLKRVAGPAQSGRSAAQRRAHPGFLAARRCPSEVLVVDDVATTGSTLSAAALTARAAGASAVMAIVAARSDGR